MQHIKQFIAGLLATMLFVTPAFAGLALNWHTTSLGPFFIYPSGTAMDVGTDNASGSCGTFANHDVATVEISVDTNGNGNPTAFAGPTGWVRLFEDVDTNAGDLGGTIFVKKLDGTETCPLTFTWTGDARANGGGQGWSLQTWSCTGSDPASVVDNFSHQGDFVAASPETAPSISSLTHSNDVLLVAYMDKGYGEPYSQPTGLTPIDNAIGTNPGGNGTTQVLTSYTILSSNAATGNITAGTSATFVRYVAGQVALNACTGATTKLPLHINSVP